MEWKKSSDGGMDFNVNPEPRKEFDMCATGYTSTFDFNLEDVKYEPQLSLKERIKRRLKTKKEYRNI